MLIFEGLAVERDERSQAVKATKLYLQPGRYLFGRDAKANQVLLLEDVSISRTHAEVTVFGADDARTLQGYLAHIEGVSCQLQPLSSLGRGLTRLQQRRPQSVWHNSARRVLEKG